MNKNKRITKKEIQKSLGADKAIKLKSGNEHGPLGLIHQMHEVQEIQKIKKECAL